MDYKRRYSLIRRDDLIIYLGIAALCLLWTFTIYWRPFHDDIAFGEVLLDNPNLGMVQWLRDRIAGWSSRIAIDAALLVLPHHPVIWRLFTALAFWLLIVIPPWFITADRVIRHRLLAISTMLTIAIPSGHYFDVGLVATTTNYLWALAAGLVAAIPAVKIIQGRSFTRWIIPAILTGIYAASSELVSVFLVVMYLAAFVWRFWYQRSLTRFEAITVGLFAIGFLAFVVFHLVNPGNALRTQVETELRFPTYGELSVWRRAEMGFSNALRTVFMSRQFIPVFYFATIAWAAGRSLTRRWVVPLALIPAAAILLFSDPHLPESYFTRINSQFDPMYGLNLFRSPGRNTILAFAVLFTLLLIAIVATVAALGNRPRTWVVLTVLALGFASRAALGFTPTIWVSGDRTNLYLLFAFGLAAMIVIATESQPARHLPNAILHAPDEVISGREFGPV